MEPNVDSLLSLLYLIANAVAAVAVTAVCLLTMAATAVHLTGTGLDHEWPHDPRVY